jgi:hypothetical protein
VSQDGVTVNKEGSGVLVVQFGIVSKNVSGKTETNNELWLRVQI